MKAFVFPSIACLSLLLSLSLSPGYAQEPESDIYDITNSTAIYITPRGQERFSQSQLPKMLEYQGINPGAPLSSLGLPALKQLPFKTETLDLDNLPLPARYQSYQATLNAVRKAIGEWLYPFEINDPKLRGVAREIEAVSRRMDIQIQFNPILSQPYDGHGFVIEAILTLPDLKLTAQDVCAHDVHNPLFGSCLTVEKVIQAQCSVKCVKKCIEEDKSKRSWNDKKKNCTPGCEPTGSECKNACGAKFASNPKTCDKYSNGFAVYHPWVDFVDSKPLQFIIPMLVELRPDGGLNLLAGVPQTNLDTIQFKAGQSNDILMPTIEALLGPDASTTGDKQTFTKVMPVRKDMLKKMLLAQESPLIRLGLEEATAAIKTYMPGAINNMTQGALQSNFNEALKLRMVPPGGKDSAPKMEWAMKPARAGWYNEAEYPANFLYLGLDGRIFDPLEVKSDFYSKTPDSRIVFGDFRPKVDLSFSHPKLNALQPHQYDFAIAANLNAVNRLIESSFKHNYLDKTSIGYNDDGEAQFAAVVGGAKFGAPPVLTPLPNGRGRIQVVLKIPTDGIAESIALKDPYHASLDMEFFVKAVPPRSFQLMIDKVNSIKVLDSDIKIFKSKVLERAKARMDKINNGKPLELSDPFCLGEDHAEDPFHLLPDDLFGMMFHDVKGAVDENGYLVFYMDFGPGAGDGIGAGGFFK